MKLKNKFIVVVPVFNQPELVVKCIDSITSQTFDDVGIIVRDDCSTDGTFKAADDFLFDYCKNNFNSGVSYTNNADGVVTLKFPGRDIVIIKNKKKLYPCGNIFESVRDYVENDDAIIGTVDGDDQLSHGSALFQIYDAYQENDPWIVWSQHIDSQGTRGCSRPLPPNDLIYSHRYYWSVSHFRTAKAWLYKQIDPKGLVDFYDKDSYIKMCGDAAILFPMIEMAGNEHAKFVDSIMYLYNNATGLNEHRPETVGMQHQYSAMIKNLPRYAKLEKKP